MKTVLIILGILVVIAVAVVVFVMMSKNSQKQTEERHERMLNHGEDPNATRTIDALLVSKRKDVGADGYTAEFFITFQPEIGDRFELRVNEADFNAYEPNDCGKLTIERNQFVSFARALY